MIAVNAVTGQVFKLSTICRVSHGTDEALVKRDGHNETWSRGYNFFSCSTKLCTKFQLLIKIKYRQMKKFLAFSLSNVVFIMLIHVKTPTVVGILTFVGWIKFVLS